MKIHFKRKQLQGLISLLVFIIMGCSAVQANSSFPLFEGGAVASIYVSDSEEPQILRAVSDLQTDIEKVTGIKPDIVHSIDKAGDTAIIIGSANSQDIQTLRESGKLQEAEGLEGLTEAFLLKSIEKPLGEVENALVVAGSDATGAVYGIYEISERIGVSPLYWWCDVVPEKQDEIILNDCLVLPKEPSVRFRGIFINDEGALTTWSGNTSKDKSKGHPSPEVYERVFELLLRLKANTVWPAMHGISSYFFEAKDENGIAINPKNAKTYGIYISTSHCENMGRNNLSEWYPWAEAHKNRYDAKGTPVFDYTVNPEAIEAYWQERLEEAKEFNMIYTLGIRGVHDSPFKYANLKNPTLENRVKVLQTVIDRQREMIKETFGSEDAVPQVFIPYEETGELYNGESADGKHMCEGVRVPEDVIMVWTEDNFGYARQLPRPHEQERSGGNGIYYHLAYQGYPTQYNWLYTTPLPLVQEELRKVYDANARTFWVVNVGDIKPAEMGVQFFMSLAYDIESYSENATKEFLRKSAKQQFGVEDEKAVKIADLITEFHQLVWPKKPEAMTPHWDWKWENSELYQHYDAFVFGDELQRQIHKLRMLEQEAKEIYDDLGDSGRAPFWHLAYYPIRSSRLMLEKTGYARKNSAYAKQGRYAGVNAYKALSEQAEAAIQTDLHHYNKQLKGGKWDGIMDPYALYNTTKNVFNVAVMGNTLVYEERFLEDAASGIGSVCEGQVIGDEQVELRFSSMEDNRRFIDIFNREINPNAWTVESDVSWLAFTRNSGQVQVEERLWVSIDWENAEDGVNEGTITVKGKDGYSKSYPVRAVKYDLDLKEKTYVEGNGFVAIEAEHYTSKRDGIDDSRWEEYQHFGYVGSSMFVKGGSKVEHNIKKNAARLEYSVYFSNAGTFYGQLYRIPTLNEGKGKSCEIAIGLNDAEPQILSGVRHKEQSRSHALSNGTEESWSWHRNVLAQMEKLPFEITVDNPGYHTVKVYQVNSDIGIDRLVICTDEQSEAAQKRALTGCPESFNNIAGWSRSGIAPLPQITAELSEVTSAQELEALTNIKFNFAMYGMPEAKGFTPVSQRNVFHKNLFGWRAMDVDHIKIEHNESTWQFPFWQRNGLRGDAEAGFYVRLKNGTYEITYYMGDVRTSANKVYRSGNDYTMSFEMNGQTLMDNETVFSGEPKVETVEVEVSDDELLELALSGNWIINALEIKRK